MELVRSSLSTVSGLPCVTVRSAPAIIFSGPAQRSLTLRPARSRSRLATLSIESSDSSVASAAASIATGWSEPVPGRELHPLESSAFHGALLRQLDLEADQNEDDAHRSVMHGDRHLGEVDGHGVAAPGSLHLNLNCVGSVTGRRRLPSAASTASARQQETPEGGSEQ